MSRVGKQKWIDVSEEPAVSIIWKYGKQLSA
jgi:hypothetical protein